MSHNRVTLSGVLGSQEVWSTSLKFGSGGNVLDPVTVDPIEMRQWALDIEGGLASVLDILLNCLSTSGKITSIAVDAVSDTGAVIASAIPKSTNITGLGTQTCPYQCAVVISSITGFAGASFRGRNYWPMLAPGLISATSRLTTPTLPIDIATNWKDLVAHIVDNAPNSAQYVVFSKKLEGSTPVEAVQVGDVIDTQRRRRDALIETYSSTPIP